MQCLICKKYFLTDTNFSSLFRFPKICPSCIQKFDIEPTLEVIPIQNGLIHYYYLYDEILVDRYTKTKLLRYFNKLYHIIRYKRDTVIIIDDVIYEQLMREQIFLIGQHDIIFLSLFRYDFVDFVNFI